MSIRRTLARFSVLPLTAAVIIGTAGSASAHVTIDSTTNEAGAYTVLTVSVPHGCEDSPTTQIAIKLPEEILAVTPTRHPFYEVEKVMARLDEPVTDAHGNTVTERVSQVVYTTQTPLPTDQRDAFELSLQLPDVPGQTLAFPTIQTCEEGETAWIEVPADGQSADELEAPAPVVEVVAATEAESAVADSADGEPSDAGAGAEAETGTEASAESAAADPDDDSSETLGIIGLVAGLLGLAAGVTALIQVRRRP